MEKKKVGTGLIAFISLLTLVIGMGLGYYLTNSLKKEVKTTEIADTTKTEETEKQVEEKTEYDGSAYAYVHDQKYKISYLSEEVNKTKEEGEFINIYVYDAKIKLYLNDKEIKTVDKKIDGSIKKYDVEAYSICSDYLVATIEVEYEGDTAPGHTETDIYVFDTEGKEIGKLEWNDETKIYLKSQVGAATYGINSDGIIMYEVVGENEIEVVEKKYTVKDGVLSSEVVKEYAESEVSLAGMR